MSAAVSSERAARPLPPHPAAPPARRAIVEAGGLAPLVSLLETDAQDGGGGGGHAHLPGVSAPAGRLGACGSEAQLSDWPTDEDSDGGRERTSAAP